MNPGTLLLFAVAIFCFASPSPAFARRQSTRAGLTIEQAVADALANYPTINVSQEQINAASAAVDLARTAYLPRLDGLVQVNRATRNNVFGLLLPQGVVPSISGPVIGSNNFGTVWGSAAGALASWAPLDFGQRSAGVSAARASKSRAESALKRTEFGVSVETADAYLTLAAAEETVRAAEAGVDRAQALARTVRAQADAQLRPGADASRADAELAAARTQLIQAQQAEQIARALLSQFIGVAPVQIMLSAPKLLQLPAAEQFQPFDAGQNPAAVEQNAVIEQKRAELHILERSYFPRILIQAAAYARGTGAGVNGTRKGGLQGLAPDTQNYAVGLTVDFPAFDLPSIHARENAESATIREETARYRQITTELTTSWNTAVAAAEGARSVAANTPVQVSAASAAMQQAMARYEAGLGTIVEIAEAQRLLTQAEIDDALARLGVWRGLLGVASAAGDIRQFLTDASQ